MLTMTKRVCGSYHSVEKNVKSFSKETFLSHSLYFSILLQIIHRMSNISNFLLFLIQGLLMKTYTTMYPYFSTSTFVNLFLLINFYFSSMLLHYPIILLGRFIANNKQTQAIGIYNFQVIWPDFSISQFSIFLD